MKSQGWKDMLDFSSREKRGIVVLLTLLLIVIAVRVWKPWDKTSESFDFTGYEAEIDSFEASLKENEQQDITSVTKHQKVTSDDTYNVNAPKFNFNPNTVSADEMKKMGFSNALIRDMENYRKAGGVFYKSDDMRKMYHIDDTFFASIEAYIIIPPKENSKKQDKKHDIFNFNPNTISVDSLLLLGFPDYVAQRWIKYREKGGGFSDVNDILKLYGIDTVLVMKLENYMDFSMQNIQRVENRLKIDLNTCEYADLIKIKNLNPDIVSKVISYRNLLGGYVKHSQLWEVYGMDSINFQQLKASTIIDTSQIQRISINKADFKTLFRHPYLNKNDVKAIMRYRNFQKEINSPEELLKNRVLNDTIYQKIKIYLSVD